ncbi:MAG: V-type ATPase 116kDa subunit family protein [Nitrososphaerales archaeon]
MGISLLSKVRIIVPKDELEEVLASLFEFEEFHPSEETPFYEEFRVVKLKSEAFELYSALNNTIIRLEQTYDFKPYIESARKVVIKADNWTELLDQITSRQGKINAKLACKIKLNEMDIINLLALREAAFATFNALRRIRIKHELKYTLLIEGYIPTKSEGKFKEQFSRWCYEIQQVRRDEKAPYVPTLLTNPKFIKLFEEITVAQGIPKYREIDPTPFVAFVFPLFYGIMFPDLGQGILLIIFGKLVSMRKKREYKYWGKMMMTFGISASMVGVITGSLFGLEIGDFLALPSLKIIEGTTISIDTVMTIIIITVIIGTYHLALAYFIAMLNKVRTKEYADAFTNHLATLVMYASSILFALSFIGSGYSYNQLFSTNNPLPVISSLLGFFVPSSIVALISLPLLVASVLAIILGRAIASLKKHEFRAKLTQGLTDVVFKPTEFLTNTISYSRLGIFLVMHSALMGLVNSAWSYGISGLPLIILGNIVVMALEGFLVYIQDLRLHMYEWFTKFHEGGAYQFTFLRPETEFVEIRFTRNNHLHDEVNTFIAPVLQLSRNA